MIAALANLEQRIFKLVVPIAEVGGALANLEQHTARLVIYVSEGGAP